MNAETKVSLVTSTTVYIVTWCVVLLMNLLFMTYIVLNASIQGYTWQITFMILCIIQVFEIVCFTENLHVVWDHIIIPSLVSQEVTNAIHILYGLLEQVHIHVL